MKHRKSWRWLKPCSSCSTTSTSGGWEGWDGGAEPRAVPRIPAAAAPASQTCEKSRLWRGVGREGVKCR